MTKNVEDMGRRMKESEEKIEKNLITVADIPQMLSLPVKTYAFGTKFNHEELGFLSFLSKLMKSSQLKRF